MRSSPGASATVRVRVDIVGVVQGVGFRPAVARVAARHGVAGLVFNDSGSVHCEFEGPPGAVDAAVAAVSTDAPPMARIDDVAVHAVSPCGAASFEIVSSRSGDPGARTLIPPDIAICADCLRELRDPADRRFGHAFITCTNCGPRYTVITGLPYDRLATTMADFPMCDACAAEYHDPLDRRFHAQTIACGDCGPRLSWSGDGSGADPVAAAVAVLHDGGIVAIKGVGGYHLACRAGDRSAVAELRHRKRRPAKPFAVMVADLDAARGIVEVSAGASEQLRAPAAPIVLCPGRDPVVQDSAAPGLRDVGVMLAYSPLHHLLFDRLGAVPLVMTSANRGGSPIVFREEDLDLVFGPAGIADGVLTHDRPIHVPCEDSVLAIDADGTPVPIRRSRGYAPLPVTVSGPCPERTVLATGGDLKTTFALLGTDGRAHLSSHLGDMADPRTQVCFDAALTHLSAMTGHEPALVACDMHPGYATTRWARRQGHEVRTVQHHHAHAVSLLAEHHRVGTPMLAVVFDGTGYGGDGTIWGGELLVVTDPAAFSRVGHLGTFALPGGEGAVRQPARIALDLLYRAGIDWDPWLRPVAALGRAGIGVLAQQIPRGSGCVPTSSMGRLFDAVASLLDVCQVVTYEGQAAVELEVLARGGHPVPLEFDVAAGVIDPLPVIGGLVDGLRRGHEPADLAAGFHHAVVRVTAAAVAAAAPGGVSTVGLTGGVFVNDLIREGLRKELTGNGFEVLTHALVPCNDGGIALGQAVIAMSATGTEGSGRCASESPAE